MAGIARGSIIGGRYVVSAIQHPWIEEDPELGDVCSAVDGILDRPVTLYTSDRENGSDIPDAARRVALIAEPHIPSILDVGTENDVVYVVTEQTGGRSLAEILSLGPLNPEQARAVVGETAEALAASATRGIYHGRLTPSAIDIDAKGGVHVRGVGIDAAAAAGEALEGKEARHTDALALVSVLYAACTAHWPAPEGAAGLPPAPTNAQGDIEPPGEVTPGIPNDLDSLAAAVFASNDDGPRSAAEVAGYLRPWQTGELAALFTRGAPVPEPEAPPAEDPARTEGDDLVLTRPIPVTGPGAAGGRPSENPEAAHPPQIGAAIRRATTRPGAAGLAAGVAPSTPEALAADPIAEALAMRSPSRFPLAASSPAAAPPRPATPHSGGSPTTQGGERTDDAATRAPQSPQTPGAKGAGAKGGAGLGAAGATAGAGAAAAGKAPAAGRPAAPQTPTARPAATGGAATPRPATFPAAAASAAGSAPTMALPTAAYAPPSGVAAGNTLPRATPPGSVPPGLAAPAGAAAGGGQPPRRNNAGRIGAIVVAAAVVVGIVVALVNLSHIGKNDEHVAEPPPATSQAAKPSPTQKPEPGPQPVFSKATSIDPQGDGDEYPELTKNVLAGEKGAWNTQTYKTAEFGGLKTGLGLALQLKEPAEVSGVDLKFAGKKLKGKFDVRASDDGEFKGSTSIKKANIDDGTVKVRFDEPVKTEYLIIWFTELPKFSDGYRVELSEVDPVGVE